MQIYLHHRLLVIGAVVIVSILVFISVEFLFIKFNGKPVPTPQIPRQAATIGSGTPLTFVILGDSTTISQGGEYHEGVAVKAAEFLARDHLVTYYNFGQSGARTTDVVTRQLSKAVEVTPDVVLLAVGANDVTHLTKRDVISNGMSRIISELKASNPDVKFVVTGSPQMGSVPRFPWPIRWLAAHRTKVVNETIQQLTGPSVAMAPIAVETGPLFEADPSLFAQDNFHPTTEGYKTWIPVITKAFESTMNR